MGKLSVADWNFPLGIFQSFPTGFTDLEIYWFPIASGAIVTSAHSGIVPELQKACLNAAQVPVAVRSV